MQINGKSVLINALGERTNKLGLNGLPRLSILLLSKRPSHREGVMEFLTKTVDILSPLITLYCFMHR